MGSVLAETRDSVEAHFALAQVLATHGEVQEARSHINGRLATPTIRAFLQLLDNYSLPTDRAGYILLKKFNLYQQF